ncbi:hypothetical protein BN2364_3321 [Alloalcanivorax xenomutans]|nr:hypothetical protein BN2364_3321 [Alloalcanivorax xenomutans]
MWYANYMMIREWQRCFLKRRAPSVHSPGFELVPAQIKPS